MERAWICRFGNQDVYRIMGRDPVREPMTALERSVFAACLYEIVSEEYAPPKKEAPKGEP